MYPQVFLRYQCNQNESSIGPELYIQNNNGYDENLKYFHSKHIKLFNYIKNKNI